MKKTLLVLLTLFTNFVFAQQSCFYDGTSHNAGFSYNIRISYKLLKSWSKARPSEVYSVKLVSVTPDSRGFYYGNQRNKFYSCSEIGNTCNPNNWEQVYVGLNGQCKTTTNDKLSFSRIGEERTIEHWTNENESCSFNELIGTVRQDGTRDLMNIIDAKERSAENKNTQNNNSENNNPATQTSTTSSGVPANTSGNDPLAHFETDSKTQSNPMTNNNNSGSSTVDRFNNGSKQAQQIVDVATGIVDLFAPTPAQLQRRATEEAEYERRQKATKDAEYEVTRRLARERFQQVYMPLMNKAVKGDENARMTLYFASDALYSSDFVPQRNKWFDEAFSNDNPEAIMVQVENVAKNGGDRKPVLQYAARLGIVDAMVQLGRWYDLKTEIVSGSVLTGFENPKLALEWFTKAAEKGSPNAMYYLGMIYKYGKTTAPNDPKFLKDMHVKYDVIIDEAKALEWFTKSIQPDYKMSLYSKESPYAYGHGAHFEKKTYKELAIMFEKGKVVAKDKAKAKEYEKLFEEYISYDNKLKLSEF